MSYRNLLALLLLSYTGFASFGATNNVIRSAAQLFTATYVEPDARGRQFEFTAQVSTSCWKRKGKYITVEDSSGAMLVSAEHLEPDAIPVPGDKVTLSGLICTNARGDPIACCQSVRRLSSGTPTPFLDFSPQAFTSGNFNFRPVRIKGVVADAFLDEIDTDFIFFIINCGGERVTVSTESDGKSASDCWKLIGSTVSVSGICCPVTHGARMFLGRTIKTAPENITVLSPASDTPFAVPEIGNVRLLQPEQVATPERRRVKGIVLATWHARNILLKTPSGELSCVSTIDWRLPHAGDTIEAVGFPETDLLHINLTRCFWRSCPPLTNAAAPPTPVTINQLLVDADGRPRINHS